LHLLTQFFCLRFRLIDNVLGFGARLDLDGFSIGFGFFLDAGGIGPGRFDAFALSFSMTS
jgi:hypothetical protein